MQRESIQMYFRPSLLVTWTASWSVWGRADVEKPVVYCVSVESVVENVWGPPQQ
jgi:hypothetical protein